MTHSCSLIDACHVTDETLTAEDFESSVPRWCAGCGDFSTQNITGGSSILPNDSGISIRILGNSSEDQKTTIYEIIKIIRKEILPDYL